MRWRLGTKIGAAFGLGLIVTTLASGVANYATLTAYLDAMRRVSHTYEVLTEIGRVTSALKDVETATRGYLLSGRKSFLDPFEQAAPTIPESIARLRNLTADNPLQATRLRELDALQQKRMAEARQLVALRAQDRANEDEGKDLLVASMLTMESIRDVTGEMTKAEQLLLAERRARADARAVRARQVIVLGAFLAAALAAGAGIPVVRAMTTSLRRLAAGAAEIGRGSLAYRLDVKRRDELGDLAAAFNGMAQALQKGQEELRHETLVLQSILDSIGDGVMVADQSGRFVAYNPAARAITGNQSGGLPGGLGELAPAIFREDGSTPLPIDELPLMRAIRGEAVDRSLLYIRNLENGSGRLVRASARPLRSASEPSNGGVTVLTDITAERAAAESIEDRERLFRTVLEILPVGICLVDLDGRVTMTNQTFNDIWADSPVGDVLNLRDYEAQWVHTGERVETAEWAVSRALREKRANLGDLVRITARDGARKTVQISAVPLLDSDQRLSGVVALSEDITERTRASEELRRAHQELEAFSYSVSHDLRAPLRHINGFAELLHSHSRDVLDEKSRRYLEKISESARDMGRLIDDLLLFSRMGRTEMLRTAVNMDQLVAEVVAGTGSDATDGQIEWTVSSLPDVLGDPAMLRQVVVNFVSNAVKYSSTHSRPVIRIGARQGDGELVFFVEDNGVGFDMKYADKLFGVFQRLHSSREFEGTGIGLATARRIIQRHGGRTWAQGAVGQGATFFFSLPKAGPETA